MKSFVLLCCICLSLASSAYGGSAQTSSHCRNGVCTCCVDGECNPCEGSVSESDNNGVRQWQTGPVESREDQGKFCVFRNQCESGEACVSNHCADARDGLKHIPGKSCVSDDSCPRHYWCENMTCLRNQH